VAQEVNADAIKWGSLLLPYRFAGSVHTGSVLQDGISSAPNVAQLITAMSDDVLATVFVPRARLAANNTGYIFVIDKRVQATEPDLPARTITLTLNVAVVKATVVSTGKTGLERAAQAHVDDSGSVRTVTLSLVGGEGALIAVESEE
jgi:hypothetical protein